MPQITRSVTIAMVAGLIIGLLLHWQMMFYPWIETSIVVVLDIGGQVFLRLLQLIVVPLVFVSIICGINHLGSGKRLGSIGIKTLVLFLLTSAIALIIALSLAQLFEVGSGIHLNQASREVVEGISRQQDFISYFIPSNIFQAMAEGQMLPLIIVTIIIAYAMMHAGSAGKAILVAIENIYAIILQILKFLIYLTPYGVFCLMAKLFALSGLEIIGPLLKYSVVMLLAIALHLLFLSYGLLYLWRKLNPILFFRKMGAAMMVAFTTSSSNAAIPYTLDSLQRKLGVSDKVAAFTVPIGATMNMDGGAIFQGMAVVFIANAFHIDLSLIDYATIIAIATLATVGTAGVPGVGVLTLALGISN